MRPIHINFYITGPPSYLVHFLEEARETMSTAVFRKKSYPSQVFLIEFEQINYRCLAILSRNDLEQSSYYLEISSDDYGGLETRTWPTSPNGDSIPP